MMDNRTIIRDYCAIRSGQVMMPDRPSYTGQEKQITPFFPELYKHLGINYPKFHKMDSLCKLGFLTTEFLLSRNDILQQYASEDIGIVLWNASSSLETDRNHQRSIRDRSAYFPSPSVFVYTLANIVIGEICIRHKIYGESTFFIDKEFNADEIHAYVQQLFDDGIVQCCLTGWLELNCDNYDGILYLIEKNTSGNGGIAIFEPQKLTELHSQRS